ncbi:MAG: phosphoribosylaminoimidazolesuccinocarboxamide synthase [Candidatus Caldatribacteriaceae bacterium]
MGSVKDLVVLSSPLENEPGKGKFIFSDRYSVFDWGEMPDHIPHKGESLCLIGAYFFEKLEKMGFETHYLGVEEDRKTKRLSDLKSPTSVMVVRLFRVVIPSRIQGWYDYGLYQDIRGNFLLPFEFIYRHFLPENSSFLRRFQEGHLDLSEYGLTEIPEVGKPLSFPILDVSTKLEEQDRYLTWKEVLQFGILQEDEILRVREVILAVGNFIAKEINRIGFTNEDGKIELAMNGNRNLVLVDVLGTPDECRFTYQGTEVSKELLRSFYRKTAWYEELQRAKKERSIGWKGLVKSIPPKLPTAFLELISALYQRIAMDLTKREWFPGIPSLEEIVDKIRRLI